jgi:hypothetical protein
LKDTATTPNAFKVCKYVGLSAPITLNDVLKPESTGIADFSSYDLLSITPISIGNDGKLIMYAELKSNTASDSTWISASYD